MEALPRWEIVLFSGHAVRRMFERGLTSDRILSVLRKGEVIDSYPDDRPYPSYLVLAFAGGQPLHVVVAVDESSKMAVVVTVYTPDSALWGDDFKTRKRS